MDRGPGRLQSIGLQSQTQLKRLSRMRMGPLLILVNDAGILWNGTIHSYLLRTLTYFCLDVSL